MRIKEIFRREKTEIVKLINLLVLNTIKYQVKKLYIGWQIEVIISPGIKVLCTDVGCSEEKPIQLIVLRKEVGSGRDLVSSKDLVGAKEAYACIEKLREENKK